MIYMISGPMTNIWNYNRGAFRLEAFRLNCDGHDVLNPATLPDNLKRWHYMLICTAMLICADRVYFLRGWQDSKGARYEYRLAQLLRKRCEFQEVI